MAILELDVKCWAEEQFGACQLGDMRRAKRAVRAAAQSAADLSGSTTQQTESWNDCKAVYRLLDQENVTFRALAEPHWKRTRAQTSGHFLLLGDTTTLDFGSSLRLGACSRSPRLRQVRANPPHRDHRHVGCGGA